MLVGRPPCKILSSAGSPSSPVALWIDVERVWYFSVHVASFANESSPRSLVRTASADSAMKLPDCGVSDSALVSEGPGRGAPFRKGLLRLYVEAALLSSMLPMQESDLLVAVGGSPVRFTEVNGGKHLHALEHD